MDRHGLLDILRAEEKSKITDEHSRVPSNRPYSRKRLTTSSLVKKLNYG